MGCLKVEFPLIAAAPTCSLSSQAGELPAPPELLELRGALVPQGQPAPPESALPVQRGERARLELLVPQELRDLRDPLVQQEQLARPGPLLPREPLGPPGQPAQLERLDLGRPERLVLLEALVLLGAPVLLEPLVRPVSPEQPV